MNTLLRRRLGAIVFGIMLIVSVPLGVAAVSNFPAPVNNQVIAGLTSGGASAISQKMVADADGVTGHQVTELVQGPNAANISAAGGVAQNLTQIGGTTVLNTRGLPVMYYGIPNTVGQPCVGVSTLGGSTIPSTNQATTLVASTTQQVLALAGSQVIHICNLDLSYSLTTGGTFSLEYGTGALCATGTTIFANFAAGATTYDIRGGNGAQDLYSVPSGNAVCVVSPAFVGSAFLNTGTSQY